MEFLNAALGKWKHYLIENELFKLKNKILGEIRNTAMNAAFAVHCQFVQMQLGQYLHLQGKMLISNQ